MSEVAIAAPAAEVAPVASTQSTATIQTNEEPAVVKPEATDGAGQKPEPTEAKPEKTAEQKELEYLRRKATKADRNNARLHQENQQYRERMASAEPQGQREPAQAGVDPVALADHIATAREVAKQSNDVVADGQKRFAASWQPSLAAVLEEAGPLIDSRSMLPTALGEAILDSKDPAALIEFLGSDPSRADSLADLSPAKLGRRIAQLEAEMNAPKAAKPVSNAPAPINPLTGNASNGVVDLESADFATYEREREKRGARWSGRVR